MGVQKRKQVAAVYRVQVIDRAVTILGVLSGVRGGVGLAEIALAAKVHKSTAHRIIMSLESQRIIDRDPSTGKYRLGLRLFELGSAAIAQFNIRERARRFLEAVVNEAGETVHLCVLDAGEVLYLDKVEPSRSIRMTSRIGLRNPVHCTAVGKAMLAYLRDDEVNAIVQRHGLKRFTATTLTTLAELKADLDKIRKCGYAVDDEEHEEGVRCVASVVRDHSGRPAAAMSISAPSFRIPHGKVPVFARTICRATQELSKEWGFENPDRKVLTAVS
jgi:DNA-binding IclR family transcriptional regulator